MYESKKQSLLSRMQFYWRLLFHAVLAALLIIGSVIIGVFGFVYFAQIPWHDAFLHAVFLLGGLGTISVPASVAGKVFLALYGLYVCLVFVTALSIVVAPVAQRILYCFHLEQDN